MDEPVLSPQERHALNSGSWFASLSPSLRHDLVRHGVLRRFADGEPIFLRGQDATCWAAVVAGNVRVGTSHPGGKQLTLCYMRPGLWFCDVSVLHDQPRSYDAHAHGAAAMLMVSLEHAQAMLREHQELYGALLRLHAARTRQVFELLQDLQTLPLRARIAKQFTQLARRHGIPSVLQPGAVRIVLQLGQEELAQLVSASRQRVNRELQELRAEGVLGMEQGRWLVRDLAGMQRVADGQPARGLAVPAASRSHAGRMLADRSPAYALAA
jgi:CRP-like cAMP-binding protein